MVNHLNTDRQSQRTLMFYKSTSSTEPNEESVEPPSELGNVAAEIIQSKNVDAIAQISEKLAILSSQVMSTPTPTATAKSSSACFS